MNIYCKQFFVRGVLISRFLDQVLFHGVLYSQDHVLTPYFMYKMHVIDIFGAFYIHEETVMANIAKIKRLQIKDILQHLIHYLRRRLWCCDCRMPCRIYCCCAPPSWPRAIRCWTEPSRRSIAALCGHLHLQAGSQSLIRSLYVYSMEWSSSVCGPMLDRAFSTFHSSTLWSSPPIDRESVINTIIICIQYGMEQ